MKANRRQAKWTLAARRTTARNHYGLMRNQHRTGFDRFKINDEAFGCQQKALEFSVGLNGY